MKKYRIITDNLDWVGGKIKSFIKGAIVYEDSGFLFPDSHRSNFYIQLPISILMDHPEWFEEVQEEDCFTFHNMRSFGMYCQAHRDTSVDQMFINWKELVGSY